MSVGVFVDVSRGLISEGLSSVWQPSFFSSLSFFSSSWLDFSFELVKRLTDK